MGTSRCERLGVQPLFKILSGRFAALYLRPNGLEADLSSVKDYHTPTTLCSRSRCDGVSRAGGMGEGRRGRVVNTSVGARSNESTTVTPS